MNQNRKAILFTLLLNIALPYVIYRLLAPHTSSAVALSAAAIVPLGESVYTLMRTRKADVFSGFIFLGLVLGVIAALLGGDERFILLRESYVTGIMGILFLLSLLFPRPLIYYFAERFAGRDPQMDDKWNRLPAYRRTFRLMTIVWGCALLLEAAIKVALMNILSISAFLVVSPIASYAIIGLTIFWNIRYVRQIRN
ncbi:VC0807 family protein [Paenibacillus ginsengihumi]|uniref:VC0807 family protein n=1 Tax=Paenibacillus ginsengihumi TaxID=431596 RepID=UPI0005937ABA|nr:VC0807 family protein [Paenibacillus ginsengihumi]